MAKGDKKTGEITEQEQTKIRDWMKSRAPAGLLCTVCQQRDSWIIGRHKTRLQAPNALLGGVGYPQVVLTCRNCGHTVLVNAILMGLEKSNDEGDDQKDGND